MKKVLIVMMDMRLGGAQKSLLSFLQSMEESPAKSECELHLMVIKQGGALMDQLPPCVQMIEPPKELCWLGTPFRKELLKTKFSVRGIWGECRWLLKSRLGLFPKPLNKQQRLWSCWHKLVPQLHDHYDTAISYIDGFTNYYVMDKVQADRKILWVHNEYQKQGCDAAYDRPYYEACHEIVTISENCRRCIVKEFPTCADKTHVLENITHYQSLLQKSKQGSCPEFDGFDGWKLLSVGRLNPLKGFDLAVEAAKLLRDRGVQFLWLIIGDGPERRTLQAMIDAYQLHDHICLIGAREDPYPYMGCCDVLVQPSRSEGRSIVLDEAKLLCKPIVVTDYMTVRDAVEHGRSGWVVDMTPEGICEGIVRVMDDQPLRQELCQYLQGLPKGNEAALKRYLDIMLCL
ncbi:MAG: glycosyltransferase [Oscillospiraceae bacterium]|nr:glycosyltransferase [Oscillospiraceae bacterium]